MQILKRKMMIKRREKIQEIIGKKVEVAVEQKNLQVPGIKPYRYEHLLLQ